jgi:hypothetical protein
MADAGIGQILDRHAGALARQAGLQHQPDGILPAVHQHHVISRKRPQHAVRQPVHHRLAQRGFGDLAGVFQPGRAHLVGHPPQRAGKDRHLAHLGQFRAAQVHDARHRAAGSGFGLGMVWRRTKVPRPTSPDSSPSCVAI